jgi:ribosomal RNA-processing protein 1
LKTYLSGARAFTPLDLLKLWKGLFYCMWMSDRPRTQQALANDLASLVAIVPSSTVLPFLRAFWLTMAREWTNIDVLRMEKFLLLTRRYVGATFARLENAGWEESVVESHLELLEEIPLNVADVKLPNGMRYHVIDVFVDELEQVGALEKERAGVSLDTLLQPLKNLGTESPTKAVRTKCREALEDERLPGEAKTVEGVLDDQEWGGIED